MSLETTLRECSASLSSERVTERKKAAETLKTFLTGNAAPSLLSDNTFKKKGYCWNNLFEDVNEYVMKEVEKSHTSKSFESQGKPLASSLLHIVVAGSNKGRAFIKCDTITNACLFVLKNKQTMRIIGDTYLSLLLKYVISQQHYVGHITPQTLEDLLDVAITACTSKHLTLDYLTRLRLVLLLIQSGTKSCQFVTPLRDALPRLEKHFTNTVTDKKVHEVLIEISVSLLTTLSTECRLTMCEFTESVTSALLQFYDQNSEHKKKCQLFKALSMIVTLHHPRGRLESQKGCLVYNWDTWNKLLHSIMELIHFESIFMQKSFDSKFRVKSDASNDNEHFYFLAASVFYQVFHKNDDKENDENEASNSSKRQKVSFNRNKSFADLLEELRQNHVPWLGVITAYVKHYGNTVTESENVTLITIIETYLTKNKEKLNWDHLGDMFCIALQKMENVAFHTELLMSSWNACVRLAATEPALNAMHTIIQNLILSGIVKSSYLQSLMKLYMEQAMPVTDCSVRTLSCMLYTDFCIYNNSSYKTQLLHWFLGKPIISKIDKYIEDLLLRLISTENFALDVDKNKCAETLYDSLFDCIEDSILISEFEMNVPKGSSLPEECKRISSICLDTDRSVRETIDNVFNEKVSGIVQKLENKQISILECARFAKIFLTYTDLLLKHRSTTSPGTRQSNSYTSLKLFLTTLFSTLTNILKDAKGTVEECELLICIQEILCCNYTSVIQKEIRNSMEADLFHSIHRIININVSNDLEDVSMQSDEYDPDYKDLRHYCILLLSAYCRSEVGFRQDILELILDPKLYNFTNNDDIELAFQTITTLHDHSVENCPIDKTFSLMQYMCKELFRNSKATGRLLSVLLNIIDKIWSHNSTITRDNCCIMINGYLARCQKEYYAPNVAALIYECLAKIEIQNRKHVLTSKANYVDLIMQGTRSNVHSLRLYCAYMLKEVASTFGSNDIENIMNSSLELFSIHISDDNERVLKDESLNRTQSFLHIFYAIAQTKSTLTKKILLSILKVHKEKSLHRTLLKKVLNKITYITTKEGFEEYWDQDILSLLHFWFTSKYPFAELPLGLLGYMNVDTFLVETNIKWLVPAEILWSKDGNIESSTILQSIIEKGAATKESLVELCFCNIIVLCLPYIVTEKYRLPTPCSEKQSVYLQTSRNANKLFQATRQVLGSDKWSNTFVESMGELVLLTASHLSDSRKASDVFAMDIPRPTETYYYSEQVFGAMLKYYGELIDDDIMQYLCENQPLAVSKVIVKLWQYVMDRNILELKCISLHAYLKLTEAIPLGYPSDPFVCNYVCNSILHAIEKTKNKAEIKVYVQTLTKVLEKFLPGQSEILKDTVPRAVSLLMIKSEEGLKDECKALLDTLVSCVDQTDGVNVLSQNILKKTKSSCYEDFRYTLTSYLSSLACPSVEILNNMKQFLSANNKYVVKLRNDIISKRFSEECETSLLHGTINTLNHIAATVADNKTVIEACNCISEIGTYEMKTLVMTAPPDSEKAVELKPVQYFTVKVVKCLKNRLFGDEPSIVSQIMLTLARLLKYREGKQAIDAEDFDTSILKPFMPTASNYLPTLFQIIDSKFESYSRLDFWVPEDVTHSSWVTKITLALLDVVSTGANYVSSLCVVCKSKPKLCREILPSLVGMVLSIANERQIACIGTQINNFLEFVWNNSFHENISQEGKNRENSPMTHDFKLIIQDVLKVVNLVRLQMKHYSKREEEFVTHNYLRLDYDKLSWAAATADNCLAALYYGELWATANNKGFPPNSPEALLKLNGGEHIQRIFRKCFTSIGESDAFDGCGSGHLTSEEEKRKHLINTGQYTDALLVHDIALSHDSDARCLDLQHGIVKSLHKSGMHHLALQYMKAMPENEQLDDIKYECLSFLGDWSVFVDTQSLETKLESKSTNMDSALKTLRYACLKNCLTLEPTDQFDVKLENLLNTSKNAVSKLCSKLNMDNCQSVYTIVSNLQLLSDIEAYMSVRVNALSLSALLDRWKVDKMPPFRDFKNLEPLIAQRSLILEHAQKNFGNMRSDIVNLQLRYAELGLTNQRVQLSQRLLAIAKKCHMSDEVNLVEGQICWAKGHREIALSLMRDVTQSDNQDPRTKAAALRLYGTWMAESRCENPREIIDKYLKRSLEQFAGRNDDADVRVKVYSDLAKYADAEYKQVVDYMKSSVFENKVKCLESMKGTASSLRSTQQELNRDERKVLITNERLSVLDEAEIKGTKAEKKRFLELAMRYYLLSLKHGEASNLSVFRVVSLWVDNPQFSFEQESENFPALVKGVPSRKFVPVLPQLAPRLTGSGDAFDTNLHDIMRRCSKEHPYHTLPILFGLKNSDKDKMILRAAGTAAAAAAAAAVSSEPRVAAAAAVVAALSACDGRLAKIVQQMEVLCDALISFANYTAKTKEVKQRVPKSELIHNIRNLDSVPVPTVTLPVRPDTDYSQIPSIVSFPDTFELVGGINCPKKMTCKGSDGVTRILLIKGEDDLRQDAVMQQVFNIVNTLLKTDPNTSRNDLSIRTYKVVALSRRSGVLEWCAGTVPVGSFLVGSPGPLSAGAHARYRPRDISHVAARKLLSACHERGKSNAEKLAAFQRIIREFKPVFHYFFTEHYLDPVTWYERRHAYTKSVAVSSMVGYILGLGDRHLQNILIDKRTAEVVHIDFGIAFDQGQALPTPETVPFRLTQDIVAGFGPSGVEGLFRRSCERSMCVLRRHQRTLLAILEVLLCDPLYSWRRHSAHSARSPAPHSAHSTEGSSVGLARRALLAAGSKLSGAEGGAAAGVAVSGQVARLLRTAQDPARLSRLFPGWQPYL